MNYNENYCVYPSGSVVGSFYDPASSVYSFPQDGIRDPDLCQIRLALGRKRMGDGTVDHMHFSYLGK